MLTRHEIPIHHATDGLQRTYQAVRLQIQAMGEPRYELGVHLPNQGMILRTWCCDQILTAIPWLRHMNGKGAHIYIRPTASLGLVLLDDVDLAAIAHLRTDGLAPTAVIETSPNNYQCWIRLIHNRKRQDIPKDLIRRLLRHLATQYGADSCAADWRHFGRLAGFTNQKACHTSRTGQPFVLLRFASPTVAQEGRSALIRARSMIRCDDRCRVPASPQTQPHTYRQRQTRILDINRHQSWVNTPDYSRIDFMIAREMLAEGHEAEVVERTILEGSPGLHTRKSGHIKDYVRRTVQAAASAIRPLSPQRLAGRSVKNGSSRTG